MSHIRLGSLAGYVFEGPFTLQGWRPPSKPGVYCIMYKPKPEKAPDKYAVIYVGQNMDMSKEGLPKNHDQYHCWVERAGGSAWKLFVAVYYPWADPLASNPRQLISLQNDLIAHYDPHCNPVKFDKGWQGKWVGEYTSSLTGPLSKRDANEKPI
jgi:hypothetical protein